MILKGRQQKMVFTLCVSSPDPFCMYKRIPGVALSQPFPSSLYRAFSQPLVQSLLPAPCTERFFCTFP